MKKNTVVALILMSTFGFVGNAFAASIFDDVPAKHWAYDALVKLQNDKIIEGYSDGTFNGDRVMSRYEMAIIVGRALTRADKANAEEKELLQKLSSEFSVELDKLDARVKIVEDKVGGMNSKIYINGRTIVKYDTRNVDKPNSTSKEYGERFIRMQLDAHAKIAGSGWTAHLSTEATKPFSTSVDQHSYMDSFQAKNVNVDGPLGKDIWAKIGTDWYALGYSTLFEERIRGGLWLNFGKDIKTQLFYGKPGDYSAGGGYSSWAPFDVYGGTISGSLNNKTNVKLSYIGSRNASNPGLINPNADGPGLFGDDKPLKFLRNAWELGLNTKVSNDFALTSVYSKSNATRDNSNTLVKLQYKAADSNVAGNYDVWLAYAKAGEKGTIAPGNDILANQKGIQLGVDYVPAPNCLLTAFYFDREYLNDYNNGSVALKAGSKDKFYRLQAQYFFW